MDTATPSTLLIQHMADLNEQAVLDLVRQRLSNQEDPLAIIDACQEGMRQVGERYGQHRYYLSGLIYAGDIFREVMEILQPEMEKKLSGRSLGQVLLGTVQGDIHDLGKDIFRMLLECYGFTVCDLGVNVPPANFASQFSTTSPDILGLSGLVTASYRTMKETVDLIRSVEKPTAHPIPIILGGNMDEQVCSFVGADYWAVDAMEGVRWCLKQVNAKAPNAEEQP